jgi:hypothetical protein
LKVLLILVLTGFAVYLLFKLAIYFYRPIFLRKMLFETEDEYRKLLDTLNKEIEAKEEDYTKWKSGTPVAVLSNSEDEFKQRIQEAMDPKKHEEEVYEKFIRLRERSVGNYKAFGKAILSYKRYLALLARQSEHANIYTGALSVGSTTFEEFSTAAKEDRIAIEESERQLDLLLNSKV